MSLGYIIGALEKIPDIPTRIKELERMIPNFYQDLPSGHHNPVDRTHRTSEVELKRYINEEKRNFMRLFEVCEYNIPPKAAKLYSRWIRNIGHSLELMKLDKDNARVLRLHELFPYWDDFNQQVKRMFKYGDSDIDLSKLKFGTYFIAKGGFGEIYYVNDPDLSGSYISDSGMFDSGVSDANTVNHTDPKNRRGGYALKLFYPDFKFRAGTVIVNQHQAMSLVRKNIVKQMKNKPLPETFIKIRAFGSLYHAEYTTEWAYITDYFDGKNVMSMLLENDQRLKDDALKGKILLTYADTMKKLHDEKRLFIDASLDSILVHNYDSSQLKICDSDMVTFIEDLSNLPSDFKYSRHEPYSSQELFLYQRPTYSSDLESFALMTHHLLLGEFFMKQDDFDNPSSHDIHSNRNSARLNIREYNHSFIKRLPKNLAELLHGLITYPKAENITANDFVQAIKSDYKM